MGSNRCRPDSKRWIVSTSASTVCVSKKSPVGGSAPPGGTTTESIAAAWDQGSRGTASVPGREAEFRDGVLRALDYAAVLDCPRVHLMAGLLDPAGSRERAAEVGGELAVERRPEGGTRVVARLPLGTGAAT